MIYFIKGENLVKIGCSSNPYTRLATFQMGCPVKLELLCMIKGSVPEERSLHKTYLEYREHCEWFRFEGKLAFFIEKIIEKATVEEIAYREDQINKAKASIERHEENLKRLRKIVTDVSAEKVDVYFPEKKPLILF